jgi:hypothetical protein
LKSDPRERKSKLPREEEKKVKEALCLFIAFAFPPVTSPVEREKRRARRKKWGGVKKKKRRKRKRKNQKKKNTRLATLFSFFAKGEGKRRWW